MNWNFSSSRGSLAARVLFALAFFASPVFAQQQTLSANHAKIELIAEETSYRPSHTLSVGLLFHLDSGWHIYWKNPGDSGQPPSIQWQLPAGFKAGAIQWPVPIRFGSKEVMDYGYEGQVLLMVPVQTPTAPSSAPVALSATVKYLVCREICIPAKADISLQISAAKSASPQFSASRDMFQQTRARFPKATPPTWKISAASHGDQFVLSVDGDNTPQNTFFLPLDESVIENSAPQTLQSSGRGFRLTLEKSNLLQKLVSKLNGVLVLGTGRAYQISTPVASH